MSGKLDEKSAARQAAERIKATPYSAPNEVNDFVQETGSSDSGFESQRVSRPWWYSQFNLMLLVFGLLGAAALLFISLAPPPVAITSSDSPIDASIESGISTLASDQESPWNEARRAQARSDAQEILSNLLDSKKFLEQKQVQSWAPTEFAQALAQADQGDEYYQQQEYQQALNIYQSSVDKLDALYEQIPIYVQSKVEQGQQAIEEGKSQLASEAFSAALALEPNNFAAMNGLSRAKILDQVLLLGQQAKSDTQLFLEQDDLELLNSAQRKLSEASTLDSQNVAIKKQAEDIAVLMQDKRYRDAMTLGFKALFDNRYAAANSAFFSALKIKPDDATASLAYQQSLASNKTSSLQSLINSAQNLEASEDWQGARGNYQAVLSRDANQVQAKLGQIRSNARYQLDAQLRETLSDPLALSKTMQKQQAQKLLSEAQAIPSPGPKLSNQIDQLKIALAQTDATIKVQIVSDSLTEITLTKEGASKLSLGRFTNKNLALKPGRYVISGVRSGFRDVRQEIELQAGNADLQRFDVRCDQPISAIEQEQNNDAT
ncbi:MAG: hypothetical protein KTR16_15285 [Acidiferrobacterales bacterium]|nr:hypothetical protein [Acidiferrobacterales bacterium]